MEILCGGIQGTEDQGEGDRLTAGICRLSTEMEKDPGVDQSCKITYQNTS